MVERFKLSLNLNLINSFKFTAVRSQRIKIKMVIEVKSNSNSLLPCVASRSSRWVEERILPLTPNSASSPGVTVGGPFRPFRQVIPNLCAASITNNFGNFANDALDDTSLS